MLGEEIINRESEEGTQVQGQEVQPVSVVWKEQGIYPEVRYVQIMFPQVCVVRAHSRRDQGKLVKMIMEDA